MKKFLFPILSIMICFFACGAETRVVRVIDGDTVVVKEGAEKVRIRLIGVDAPEIVHPDYEKNDYYGPESKACLAQMIEGTTVLLVYDGPGKKPKKDDYGRTLAYIYKNGENVNAAMIQKGCARAYRKYPHSERDRFIDLEMESKKAKRGMWSKR